MKKYYFLTLLLATFSVVNAQMLFIETDYHDYMYYDEQNDKAIAIESFKETYFFGIDDDITTVFRMNAANQDLIDVFMVDDWNSKENGALYIYAKDIDKLEYMILFDPDTLFVIFSYINESDDVVYMNRYSIKNIESLDGDGNVID